jgi:hypothetical protein
MDVAWNGTDHGENEWTIYKNEDRLVPKTIIHNLQIPVASQGFRVRFRDYATTNHILGHGNFYLLDETSLKFQVLSLTENSITFELYPRVVGLMEYQVDILKEPDHYSVSMVTGGSVDSQGMDVFYTLNWGDGSELIWSLEPTQSHIYTYPGTYMVRAKSRAAGIETSWSLPKSISVYNRNVLVYTPIIESGASNLVLDEIGTFIVKRDSVGTTEEEEVEVRFDWGDYTYSDWSSNLYASHIWNKVGTYNVKVQTRIKDSFEFSLWSEPYSVVTGVVALTVSVVEPSLSSLTKTPSPVLLDSRVLVNSSFLVDTQRLNLTPTQVVEFMFDFGDGSSYDWSDVPSVYHVWRNLSSVKVLCKMRVRDLRYPELGWIDYDWSDTVSLTVVSRILTNPSVPEGTAEILCRTPNKFTEDPPGEITEFSFEKKWVSDWMKVPSLGIVKLSHPGGCIPYLIHAEFDLEGNIDERLYEEANRTVTDDSNKEITVMNHYLVTENSFYLNFHKYIESESSYTGSRVMSIVSRYRVYMRF